MDRIRSTEEVDFEEVARLLLISLLNRRKKSDAGVVDEDIDTTEMLFCRPDDIEALASMSHIERKDQRISPLCKVCNFVSLTSGYDNLLAIVEKVLGDTTPKPSRATGYKPNEWMIFRHGVLQ
jgi:hypothetical protein